MTDFRIDVVIDPRPAQRGAQVVDRELGKLEQDASDLRQALVEALAVRDHGTAAALGRIEDILERTEERAIVTDTRLSQIGKDINDRGVRRLNKSLDETAVKGGNAEAILRKIAGIIGVAVVARQFVLLSDEATSLSNKLRTVISDQEQLNATYDDLRAIATRTRSDLGSIVTLYQRGSIAAGELGASNAELLQFVEKVGKGLAVQGTSAREAQGALLQLSQALGSGTVRAEEFNSILEGAFPIAQAVARGIERTGGSVAKLRQEVVAGNVTSREFFEGFLAGSGQLEQQFDRTSTTIGQAFTNLRTETVAFIKDFNEATGASTAFAEAIGLVADGLPVVITLGATTALVIGQQLAATALPKATANMKAFIASAGPLLSVAAAASAVSLAISSVAEEYEAAAATLAQSEDDVRQSFNGLGSAIALAQREINGIRRQAAESGNELSEAQQRRIEQLQRQIEATRAQIRGQTDDTRAAKAAVEEAAVAQKAQEEALARQAKILNEIRGPAEEYAQFQKDLRALLDQNRISQQEFNKALTEAAPKTAAKTTAVDPFAQQVESLRKQNAELKIRAENFGIQREGLLLELDLQQKGVAIDDEKRSQLAEILIQRRELNEKIKEEADLQKVANTAQDLRDQITLGQTKLEQGQQEADFQALIIGFRKQGITLTDEQVRIYRDLLGVQQEIRDAEEQQQRVERLRERIDLTAQFRQEENDLLELLAQEPSLAGEINRAFEDLRLRQLQGAEDVGSGFERAFIKLQQEARDFSVVGETVVNSFADNATEAILNFTKTGEFAFKEFATAIIDDILRVIVRLLVLQAIQAAVGVFGGPVAGAGASALGSFIPGRAAGGGVGAGQPVTVGENGVPEIFVPNQGGRVLSGPQAQAAMQQQPPEVKLAVIQASNENAIRDAIAAGDFDDVIVSVAQRKPDAYRKLTS